MDPRIIEEEKKEVPEEEKKGQPEGQFIRRLEQLRELGAGDFGRVHLARLFDETGFRYVAVKF